MRDGLTNTRPRFPVYVVSRGQIFITGGQSDGAINRGESDSSQISIPYLDKVRCFRAIGFSSVSWVGVSVLINSSNMYSTN